MHTYTKSCSMQPSAHEEKPRAGRSSLLDCSTPVLVHRRGQAQGAIIVAYDPGYGYARGPVRGCRGCACDPGFGCGHAPALAPFLGPSLPLLGLRRDPRDDFGFSSSHCCPSPRTPPRAHPCPGSSGRNHLGRQSSTTSYLPPLVNLVARRATLQDWPTNSYASPQPVPQVALV